MSEENHCDKLTPERRRFLKKLLKTGLAAGAAIFTAQLKQKGALAATGVPPSGSSLPPLPPPPT